MKPKIYGTYLIFFLYNSSMMNSILLLSSFIWFYAYYIYKIKYIYVPIYRIFDIYINLMCGFGYYIITHCIRKFATYFEMFVPFIRKVTFSNSQCVI